MAEAILLNGTNLTAEALRSVANGAPVAIDPAADEAMARGRAIVEHYFAESIPAYGLTTGLGMRADRMLSREEAAEFSYHLVRGRAQGVGDPLDAHLVRAVMAVRLNTMLGGEAGASPRLAHFVADVLNANLTPWVPGIGSIGAGDLVVMSGLALALIGEGEFLVGGQSRPATDVLRQHHLAPIELAPKDGLVLCNSTAFSAAMAALALASAQAMFGDLQKTAALSLEAFVANISPFEATVLRARPQPGQVEAGDEIRDLLVGGSLLEAGAGRRLQDPLSFRCLAQTHGVLLCALKTLETEVHVHLNSSPDNPVVLLDEQRCVSNGNFHTPGLTHTLDAVSRALAWCANDAVARIQRLMHAPFSALPPLLSSDSANSAGFGPLLKPIEALRAEIIHLATPVPILPSHNADGVEDTATFAPLAAQTLTTQLDRMSLLVAFELIAACQAIDLRRIASGDQFTSDPQLGPQLLALYRSVRAQSRFIDADRPVGREVEQIARALKGYA